jgi:nucleotide-binding universal stress UspA family protein
VAGHFEALKRKRLEAEGARLEDLDSRIRSKGLAVRKVLLEGTPGRGLQKAAMDVGAQLIVLGDRGRTGDPDGRLGGVVERVVKASDRLVLVARARSRSRGGFGRVLVATDFSGRSDRLMEAARSVSAPDAGIDVLYCWRLPLDTYSRAMVHDSVEDLERETRTLIVEQARQRGEDLVARHAGGDRSLRFVTRQDRARRGIVRQLEEDAYDLVVVGSHGRRGFRRFTLGSTAAATIRRAATSVLVVPDEVPNE